MNSSLTCRSLLSAYQPCHLDQVHRHRPLGGHVYQVLSSPEDHRSQAHAAAAAATAAFL